MMIFKVFAIAAFSLALSACGNQPHKPSSPATHFDVAAPAARSSLAATLANDVLFHAISLVGTPYRFGGNTPAGGFDCSGLVGYVFRESASVLLPRNSQAIAKLDAPKVDRKKLVPGDLVFFGRKNVNHLGIYVGEGRFVHAPSTGGTVRMDALDGPYWKDNYLYAKRVIR